MADEKQHKSYSQKRLIWTNRITEMYTIAVNAKTRPDIHLDFKTRYASLEEMYEQFNTTHNHVVSVVDDDGFKSEDAIRKQVDTYYFSIKSTYNELFSALPSHSPLVLAPSSQRSRSHLPTLNLPKFNGNLKMWPTFFDCFRNTVHDDPDISPVEKFRHLLSLLEDEPFKLVKSLPLSDANYRTAYDMLVKRYQNKRLIATHALTCILTFNLKSNSNAKELRKLLDNFSEGLSILKNLGSQVDKLSDFLLLNTLLQKLEDKIRTEFEVAVTKKEIPSIDDLIKFLETHCKALESVQDLSAAKPSLSLKQPLQPPKRPSYPQSHTPKNNCSSFTNVIPSTQNCALCKGNHLLTRCPAFASKSPNEIFTFAKQANLCLNCLSSSHLLKKCPSNYRCRSCNYSHHTLLHMSRQGTPSSGRDPPGNSQSSSGDNCQSDGLSANASSSYATSCATSTVLLGTAMVNIQDSTGHYRPIRILIDSASQASFISEKCIRQLGLLRRRYNIPILGLNQMRSQTSNGMTHCRIKPQNLSTPVFSFEAIVLPNLCTDMPSIPLNGSRWKHIKHLNLADKTCQVPRAIDVLIGAELVPHILLSGRIPGTNGQPSALETIFGWILIGKVQNSSNNALAISSYCTSSDLDTCLQRFWEIDNITHSLPASPDDEHCENVFSESTYRDNTGRFTVSLPFKCSNPDLGHSYSFAYRSFLSLEKRLAKNTDLRSMYVNFMRDYLDTHHMSLSPITGNKSGKYYIPHHCVLKPDSCTTKLRVVFNASNPTSTGLSLNDALLPGPKLQKDIATILLSFRIHNYVFMADIKQMSRQILLHPAQRDFQRILWRFSPEDPLREYILNTLVYGIKSSAYLAIRTLTH